MDIKVKNNLEKSLKLLKRDFESNIAPSIRRHQYHRSKSQMRKEKVKIKTSKKLR